jgi:hypothetical protein
MAWFVLVALGPAMAADAVSRGERLGSAVGIVVSFVMFSMTILWLRLPVRKDEVRPSV